MKDLIRLGVPMALTTDLTPGTSPVYDMATVMNMGCVLFGLTCEQALAGATINGAKALGLGKRKGRLETGKDADFVLWNIDAPADLSYQVGLCLIRVIACKKNAFPKKNCKMQCACISITPIS